MTKSESFRTAVEKAIAEYNKYRSPEATVILIEIGDRRLKMDFAGSFCQGCDVSDYFEDFIDELKQHTNVDMTISDFEQKGLEKFRVTFAFKLRSYLDCSLTTLASFRFLTFLSGGTLETSKTVRMTTTAKI